MNTDFVEVFDAEKKYKKVKDSTVYDLDQDINLCFNYITEIMINDDDPKDDSDDDEDLTLFEGIEKDTLNEVLGGN